jgi:hypothetical protein
LTSSSGRASSRYSIWTELAWKLGPIVGLSAAFVFCLPFLIVVSLMIGILIGEQIDKACRSKYTQEQLRLLALLDRRGWEEKVLAASETRLPIDIQQERAELRELARQAGLTADEIEDALDRGSEQATQMLTPGLIGP